MGKKQRKRDAAASLGTKLPTVTPSARCKLRLLKLERVKDYLLMEHEFVQNQERLKPQDERNEEDRSKVRRCRCVCVCVCVCVHVAGTVANRAARRSQQAAGRGAYWTAREREAAGVRGAGGGLKGVGE